jgi:hypothetical protein
MRKWTPWAILALCVAFAAAACTAPGAGAAGAEPAGGAPGGGGGVPGAVHHPASPFLSAFTPGAAQKQMARFCLPGNEQISTPSMWKAFECNILNSALRAQASGGARAPESGRDDDGSPGDDDFSPPPNVGPPLSWTGLGSIYPGSDGNGNYTMTLNWPAATLPQVPGCTGFYDGYGNDISYVINTVDTGSFSVGVEPLDITQGLADQFPNTNQQIQEGQVYCYMVTAEIIELGVQSQIPIVGCAVAAPVFYVDSTVPGSESPQGSANDPFTTLAQVQAAMENNAAANFFFAGGPSDSEVDYLGSLNLPSNGFFGLYGAWDHDAEGQTWTYDPTRAATLHASGFAAPAIGVGEGTWAMYDSLIIESDGGDGIDAADSLNFVFNTVFASVVDGANAFDAHVNYGGLCEIAHSQFPIERPPTGQSGIGVNVATAGQGGYQLMMVDDTLASWSQAVVFNQDGAGQSGAMLLQTTATGCGVNAEDAIHFAATNGGLAVTNLFLKIFGPVGATSGGGVTMLADETTGALQFTCAACDIENVGGDAIRFKVVDPGAVSVASWIQMSTLYNNGGAGIVAEASFLDSSAAPTQFEYDWNNNVILGMASPQDTPLTTDGIRVVQAGGPVAGLNLTALVANNFIGWTKNTGMHFSVTQTAPGDDDASPNVDEVTLQDMIHNNDVFSCPIGVYIDWPAGADLTDSWVSSNILQNVVDLEFVDGAPIAGQIDHNDLSSQVGGPTPDPDNDGNINEAPLLTYISPIPADATQQTYLDWNPMVPCSPVLDNGNLGPGNDYWRYFTDGWNPAPTGTDDIGMTGGAEYGPIGCFITGFCSDDDDDNDDGKRHDR